MIGEETKWLDELDAKLAKGLLRASADAEELSEELDVSRHFCIWFHIELRFFSCLKICEFLKKYVKMHKHNQSQNLLFFNSHSIHNSHCFWL